MAINNAKAIAGRIGAHTRWAKEPDRKAATAPARRGFRARFEREVDPEGKLPPAELARRTDHAISAHMCRLALAKSKKATAKTADPGPGPTPPPSPSGPPSGPSPSSPPSGPPRRTQVSGIDR